MDDLRLLICDLTTKPFIPLPNQQSKINNHQSAISPLFAPITGHHGQTPVILHFQNSARKRLSLQPSPIYHVKRSPELHQALDRHMEE